jgi:hypothetical protein
MLITDAMIERACKAFWEAPSMYGDERPPWTDLPAIEQRAETGPVAADMRAAMKLALEAALHP